MKTIKLAVFFLSFFSFSLQAQFNAGLKAGLNFSDINVDQQRDAGFDGIFDSKTGYHVGAFLEIPLAAPFGLRGEAMFSTKGADNNFQNEELNLDYLTVPILLKIKPLNFWSIHAGGEFGFKLEESKLSIFDDHNMDIGWAFGTSIKLFNRLGVEVRYLHGTTDLGDGTIYSDINGDPVDVKFKNRSFQVSVEYYLFDN